MSAPESFLFQKRNDESIHILNEMWPMHIHVENVLLHRIESGETIGTRYDGEELRFDVANGWAIYRRIHEPEDIWQLPTGGAAFDLIEASIYRERRPEFEEQAREWVRANAC